MIDINNSNPNWREWSIAVTFDESDLELIK